MKLEHALQQLAALCDTHGVAAWLVGGATRDLARGRQPVDIDLAVDGDGLMLARAFADAQGGAYVELDDERSTGRAVIPDASSEPTLVIDIARLRAPTIEGDLRLRDFTVNAIAVALASIQTGSDRSGTKRFGEGQAFPEPLPGSDTKRFGDGGEGIESQWWTGEIIDPTGGLSDLRAGLLRPCSPTSLADDPLRSLRAARLCAGLDLQPVAELSAQIREAAPLISQVAAERVRDELLKLLDSPSSATWIRYIDECGLLTQIFPELEPARGCDQPRIHFLPVLAHMLETVASLEWIIEGPGAELPVAVEQNPDLPRALPYAERLHAMLSERRRGGHRRAALLKLAALLHDNAKPQTKERHPDGKVSFYGHQEIGADIAAQIGRRLRLSRADCEYLALVVREHMRPGQLRTSEVVTPRAVARFFRDLGDTGPDVLLHELADHMATRGPLLLPGHWDAHVAWIETMLDSYWGHPDRERQLPLLRGNELISALGLDPGPIVGRLLEEIAEARAAGEIGTPEEAIELARRLLAEIQEAAPGGALPPAS